MSPVTTLPAYKQPYIFYYKAFQLPTFEQQNTLVDGQIGHELGKGKLLVQVYMM